VEVKKELSDQPSAVSGQPDMAKANLIVGEAQLFLHALCFC
jgi:hypothetical protein